MTIRRRPLSIKQRLTLFFLVFFCVPFLIIGYIWYTKSTATIESSVIVYNKQLIGQLNDRLDDYFSRMKADTQALPGNPLIQEFVKFDPNDAYGLFQIKDRIGQEMYPTIVYRNHELIGFYIYSVKGAALGDLLAGNRIDFRNLNEQDESFKIVGISDVGGVPAVMFYRNIFDNTTYRFAGAMVFAFSLDRILKTGDLPAGKSGTVAIADSDGRLLYHPDPGKRGETLPTEWRSSMTASSGYFVDKTNGEEKIIVYSVSKNTHLTTISEVPTVELTGDLSSLRTITMIIGFAILVLAFVTFNKMLLEIKKLVEVIHGARIKEKEMEMRQREAMFQALQSQINPHFLYNCLEIINSYAILAKVKPISQMTVLLAGMFRYSVDDSQRLVRLRDEIEHIRNYFKIQEERYERLRVSIDIEDGALDRVSLFRLTLQPIVENAIVHAYEKHGLHPGEIAIVGTSCDGYFSLKVEDKGQGMAPHLLERLNEAFVSANEQNMLAPGYRPWQAIGLWNVHSRLRLAFGPPFGLFICRSDSSGTVMEIKLPYESSTE